MDGPVSKPGESSSSRSASPSIRPLMAASGSSSSMVGPAGTSQMQQVGSRQGMRSRSRTTRKASVSRTGSTGPGAGGPIPPSGAAGASSTSGAGAGPSRYRDEDHPLSAHKLAERGYHSFSCLGVPFHVPKRYTFLRELGIGAYGCVALARDEELDMNVA